MYIKKRVKKNNLHVAFILYVIFALLLQIIGIDAKGTTGDTIYKIIVLTFFYFVFITFAIKRKAYSSKYIILILVFLFTQSITILINDFWSFTNISVYLYFTLMTFLFLVLLRNIDIEESDFINFARLFIIFVFISSIYSFILNYNEIVSFSLSSSSYSYNFTSFFDSRNTFSYFLYLAIALNIYLLKTIKKKIFFYLTLLIMFFSLLLTFSRSSIISLLIFIIVYTFIISKIRTKLMFFLVIVIFITLYFSNDIFKDFFMYVFRPEVGLTGRYKLYQLGLDYFNSNNLFFGSGYVKPISNLILLTSNVTYHNTFISILTYGGLFFLSFFILLLCFVLSNILKLMRYNKRQASFFLSLFVSYISYSMVEEQLLFFTSVSSFVITLLLVFYPMALLNRR